MIKREKNAAFTLAEALITLTIIGLIAALTIPGLKKFSEKETAVLQLKKSYHTMNMALDRALAVNNFDLNLDKIDKDVFFEKYLRPGLAGVKYCNSSNLSGCLSTHIQGLTTTIKNAVVLSDGSVVASNGTNYIVDINGPSEPNVVGGDVFEFKLLNVKGERTAAIFDYNKLMASVFNYMTPSAIALVSVQNTEDSFMVDDGRDVGGGGGGGGSIGGGGGGTSGGGTGSSGSSDNDVGKNIIIEEPTPCASCGWCNGVEKLCNLPFDPNLPKPLPNPKPDIEPDPSDPVVPDSGDEDGGDNGGHVLNPDAEEFDPNAPLTPDDSGQSGTGDSGKSYDEATNTAGWRFVPVGKTVEVMNNNWKIKLWGN